MSKSILGIHDGHNSTAALLKEGKLVDVLQEERLLLFRQALQLLHRLALIALVHFNVVSLGPLFTRLKVNLTGITAFAGF